MIEHLRVIVYIYTQKKLLPSTGFKITNSRLHCAIRNMQERDRRFSIHSKGKPYLMIRIHKLFSTSPSLD